MLQEQARVVAEAAAKAAAKAKEEAETAAAAQAEAQAAKDQVRTFFCHCQHEHPDSRQYQKGPKQQVFAALQGDDGSATCHLSV